jgi:hypothetical protein
LESTDILFLQISKHNPETCPMHHEKAKKATIDLMAKMDRLQKKHRIKEIGSWHSMPNHLLVAVYDVQSMEDMMGFATEPEVLAWMSYWDSQVIPVTTAEEAMNLLK